MTIMYIIIPVVVFLIIVVLYLILKDDSENIDMRESEVINLEKKSYLSEDVFLKWLKDIKIENDELKAFKDEIWKKIIWMDEFINAIVVNILVWSHLLVEWVPWLAKTKTIETISKVLDMDFKRAQFTPDMIPSDIVWVEIYNSKMNDFEIKKWVVFTNIFLADEINRTSPKVQSALLEAMQEKKVSIWWEDLPLPKPFFVLATQNPVEQEWTYPLPEAQLDRFLFKVLVDYPNAGQEKKMLDVLEKEETVELNKIITKERFLEIQEEVRQVVVSDSIKDYISRLVNETRLPNAKLMYWWSPRASIWLMNWWKALAYIQWRDYVTHEDIQRLVLLVLRHRIILNYEAKVEWLTEDQIIMQIVKWVTLE